MTIFNLKKGKKGAIGFWSFIGGGAIIAIIAVLALGFIFKAPTTQKVLGGDGDADIPANGKSTFCANNPSLDLEARCEDSLVTGTNGLNCTLVVKDLAGGAITTHTIDTADASTTRDTFANVVTCGATVEVGIITTIDQVNSNRNSFLKFASSSNLAEDANKQRHTQRDPVKYDGETTRFSPLTCRAKDEDQDIKVNNGTIAGDQSTAFTAINVAGTNFSSSTSNGTKDIDATDTLDYIFKCKVQTADSQFGEITGMWIDHQDSDGTSDDFEDNPELSYAGGIIADTSGSAATQDGDANTAFDLFYNFGAAIGDKAVDTQFKADPKSGEDPDNKITFKFVGAGIRVKSGDTTLLIGDDKFVAYDTDTAKTQIATATDNSFIVDIQAD